MNATSDVESPLPDLTEIELAQLRASEDSVLQKALRRILDEIATGQDVVAGFNSAL
jgi:FXSXX-COOH protein